MDTGVWLAKVARDVAAPEATVQHMAVTVLRGKTSHQLRAECGRATRAAGGAQVHVRQLAVKEPGQCALDAVRVKKYGVTMQRAQPRQLAAQG